MIIIIKLNIIQNLPETAWQGNDRMFEASISSDYNSKELVHNVTRHHTVAFNVEQNDDYTARVWSVNEVGKSVNYATIHIPKSSI